METVHYMGNFLETVLPKYREAGCEIPMEAGGESKKTEPYLVAHTTIAAPYGYTVLTIVPEEEALKPIESMTQMITHRDFCKLSALAITSVTALLVYFWCYSRTHSKTSEYNGSCCTEHCLWCC